MVELIVFGFVINGNVSGIILMFLRIAVFDFFCLFCLFSLSLSLIIDIVIVIIRIFSAIRNELIDILKSCRIVSSRKSEIYKIMVIDRLVVRLVLFRVVVV